MAKIKVLNIIKSLGRGGAEVLLPETLHYHDKENFEFHYIYYLSWKTDVVKDLEDEGGKVTCLNKSSNIKILLSAWQVEKYCKKNEIDIIHIHSPLPAITIRLLRKSLSIPICYTEHSIATKYKNVVKILNKKTYNYQDCVIACSDIAKQSIDEYIKPKVPVFGISNGVNTEKYKPAELEEKLKIRRELSIPEDAVVVIIIAVLRTEKRVDNWLNIVNQAISKNNKIHGIIVGSGPLEEELKAQHQKLENKNQIHFVGKQLDVKPYLATSDIYMMTSEFEGLPVSLLEAMSCELAICSTEAGGIKKVVRNNIDGLTVPTEKPKELINILVKISQNETLLKDLKKKARNRIIESFSLRKMVDSLEKIYIDLYNGNKKV
ncbi:glycosyltransferase family 4 protein [Ornithobacterium rhinotracheale]|uniref:glycosyltransferase family 4 protein n=1 Tax=Ornithobacterium rhinotracheale TaxID=28251 RepID=UPI004036E9B9